LLSITSQELICFVLSGKASWNFPGAPGASLLGTWDTTISPSEGFLWIRWKTLAPFGIGKLPSPGYRPCNGWGKLDLPVVLGRKHIVFYYVPKKRGKNSSGLKQRDRVRQQKPSRNSLVFYYELISTLLSLNCEKMPPNYFGLPGLSI
jgi:hypothetical protein